MLLHLEANLDEGIISPAVLTVIGVGSVDDDTGGGPVAYRMNGFGVVGCAVSGDEVVQGGDGTIAIFAAMGVGVHGIVKTWYS